MNIYQKYRDYYLEYNKKYRVKNRNKIRLNSKKYRDSDKGQNTQKKWCKNNRYRINKVHLEYYYNNKKKVLAQHIAHHKRFKEHYYAYKKKWLKTVRGKLNQVLVRVRKRCNDKTTHNFKYYGGRGIKCLLKVDDLLFIWKRDNANKLKRPSIDRINNDGPYSRRNCQFIEHSANVRKQWIDRRKSVGKKRRNVSN